MTTSSSIQQRCALVFEDAPSLSVLLQNVGWKAIRFSPHQINTGTTANVGQDIKKGLYDLLWIDMPLPGRHIAKDRMHSALTQLCRWLQLASECGVPAGLFGAFGNNWKHTALLTLVSEHNFAKSYHRACHFKLKLNKQQTQPSKICFVYLGNPRAQSHICKCQVAQNEHRMDWSTHDASISRRPRMQLQQTIAQEVLKQLVIQQANAITGRSLHHDTPDSNIVDQNPEVYPTITTQYAECCTCQLLMPVGISHCLVCDEPFHNSFVATTSNGSKEVPADVARATHDGSTANQPAVWPPDVPQPFQSYPTEERMRQKQRLKKMKEAGIKPRTRAVHVEEKYDDCGTDTSALSEFLDLNEPAEPALDAALTFIAVDILDNFELKLEGIQTYYATDLKEALHVLACIQSKVDIVEVCGGTARTSRIAIRKHLKVGCNFDLVTDCDLNDTQQQSLVRQYFRKHKPLVAVLTPRCSAFGAHSNQNYRIRPQGWERTYQESAPHARFCGELALLQDQEERYFVLEQPQGSWIYLEHPWNIVCHLPSVDCITIHQCMLGQRGPNNLLVKKPTDFIANHPKLLEPLRSCQCDRRHKHESLDGGRSKRCEVWPWALAQKVCEGIIKLKIHLMTSYPAPEQAYPTRGTSTADVEDDAQQSWRRCPGCRGRQSKFDPRHTRMIGECLWPDVTPVIWDCPACKKHRPFGHPDHTHGPDCKHAVISHRVGVPRTGKHPRAPARPASASVSADLQPQLPDGSDLGEVDEHRARERAVTHDGKVAQRPPPEILRLSDLRSWATACNGDPALIIAKAASFALPRKEFEHCRFRTTWIRVGPRWYQLELAVNLGELDNPAAILPGLADLSITIFHPSKDVDLTPFLTTTMDIVPIDRPEPTREFAERSRRTFRDAAEGTEHHSDWTRFNVGRSLKALSVGSPDTQMRELRKLHLRWWHCSKEAMRRVLHSAGPPASILNKVTQVVDTCRECRAWARPANKTIPTMRMSTAFNEHVEVDLMFYKEHTIFHMICCATRWHAAALVRSRQEEELLSATHKIWLSIHGPMQQLISDGELGISGDSAQAKLKRLGISLKIRAPGQHARFIERRGAILRTTLHCIESQLVREGVQTNMDSLLSEAVFAGNTLIHVGGATPYQCIYGRTPAMMPPVPDDDGAELELDPISEQARHKVRTVALESMIQATSLARTNRALRAKAVAATETPYHKGDLVDYHRPTGKDVTGWQGPVEVVESKPEEGIVIVQIDGKPRP